MLFEDLRPKLANEARIKDISADEALLLVSEIHSKLNKTGIQIVHMLDGNTTINSIIVSMLEKYPTEDVERIKKSVSSFIISIWKKGVFLEHNIDETMCEFLYKSEEFRIQPSFCAMPDLQLEYLSPSAKSEMFMSLKTSIERLGGTAKVVIRRNEEGVPASAVVIVRTACPQTYSLFSVYGEPITSKQFYGIKCALYEHLNIDEMCMFKESDQLHLLVFNVTPSNTSPMLENSEEKVCILKKEMAFSDLVVTKYII